MNMKLNYDGSLGFLVPELLLAEYDYESCSLTSMTANNKISQYKRNHWKESDEGNWEIVQGHDIDNDNNI